MQKQTEDPAGDGLPSKRMTDGACYRLRGREGEKTSFSVFLHEGEEIQTWDPVYRNARKPLIEPEHIRELSPLDPNHVTDEATSAILDRVFWNYPHRAVLSVPAKASVSELKRRFILSREASDRAFPHEMPKVSGVPRFIEGMKKLSATELGTLTHLVLQHVDLGRPLDEDDIHQQIDEMVQRELLAATHASQVPVALIANFFRVELGQRLKASRDSVQRELPFTLSVPARYVSPGLTGEDAEEPVLVQGIIDCLIDDPDGLVLIDFKTDRVSQASVGAVAQGYEIQMMLYRLAVERSFKKGVKEAILYFLRPGIAWGSSIGR